MEVYIKMSDNFVKRLEFAIADRKSIMKTMLKWMLIPISMCIIYIYRWSFEIRFWMYLIISVLMIIASIVYYPLKDIIFFRKLIKNIKENCVQLKYKKLYFKTFDLEENTMLAQDGEKIPIEFTSDQEYIDLLGKNEAIIVSIEGINYAFSLDNMSIKKF